MSTLVTVSGRRRELPEGLDPKRVAGVDEDSRIVMADPEGDEAPPFLFGLTLCCNAYDKGVEHGIVCRGCYGDDDIGNYLWRDEDGDYYGLDPVDHIED